MASVKTATGLIAAYMRLCGFAGWASFWRVVYVLPNHKHDERLLRHERKHLEQIERDGRVVFAIRYLWWSLLYGYHANAYEMEARKTELNLDTALSERIISELYRPSRPGFLLKHQ